MEKISVIIPAFNAEKYLAETIESVKKQNWHGESQIIIIDDGSEDGTISVAKSKGGIVFSKERGGAASARNMGIRFAVGKILLFLDADDVLRPGAFSSLFEPLVSHTEIMAVFGRAQDFISPELTSEQRNGLYCRKNPYSGVLPGCALIQREVFDKIGFFDEKLKTGETVAWQMKLRDAKIPIVNINVVTVDRRLHMNNTGRLAADQELSDYAAILRRRMKKNDPTCVSGNTGL